MYAIDDSRSAIRPAVPPSGKLFRVTADRADDHPLVGIERWRAPCIDDNRCGGAAEALVEIIR
jgi:hypothetical protein